MMIACHLSDTKGVDCTLEESEVLHKTKQSLFRQGSHTESVQVTHRNVSKTNERKGANSSRAGLERGAFFHKG